MWRSAGLSRDLACQHAEPHHCDCAHDTSADGENESEFIYATGLEAFAETVIAASQIAPVLVDFWAEWCPPCVALTPVLERVTRDFAGRIRLATVEVDEGDNMKLAGRYGLKGFPTVLLFDGGEIKGRFSGARATHWVRDFLAEHGIA
jgi:putative thioredoxin